MQWLVHTLRTLFRRHAALGVAVVAAPVVLVGVVIALVVGTRGADVAAAPDPLSDDYSATVLDRLGTTPAAFVDDVVGSLLPGEGSADTSSATSSGVTGRLADVLGVERSAAAVADSFVRRLGVAASEATSTEELVERLASVIDPDASIDSADDLVDAVGSWAARTSPHVLHLIDGVAGGALPGLENTSFDAAVSALAELDGAMQVIEIGLDGIDGVGSLTASGVVWQIDDVSRSIFLAASTDDLGGASELFVVASWGGDTAPSILTGVRLSDWRLADAGFTGELGERLLPSTTFLIAGRSETLTPDDVSDATWQRLTADLGTSPRVLALDAGVNALTVIDGATLPTAAEDILARGDRVTSLGVRGSFGPGFGAVDGTSVPARAVLTVEVPGLEPPALPTWLSTSDELPWALTLAVDGSDLEVGLAGGLDAELDGGTRSFAAQLDASSDGATTTGRLVADLRSPWPAPFGLDWLDLDALTMTVDLGEGGGSASFEADVVVAQRSAALRFDLDATGATSSVRMLAAVDELTASDAATFLTTATGAAAPADVPALAIDDVLIEIQTGERTTVAIGGHTRVAGQDADVLAGVESVDGESGIMLGVALDAWRLGDVLPAVSGTLLEELEFPPSALVLSSLDGAVDQSELSEPARRFFGGIDGAGELTLSPGVSLFAALDLRGTALEDPMAALGFADGRFPVVGTLPGSVIGLADPADGAALAGLALAVELPEVAPAGAPEWFRGGQLALVATGQPSLGLEGEMTLRIDGEDLTFLVAAEFARTSAGAELAVFGALETERPWESPFGVEWLTVNDLALALTVDPVGTVGLGFAGAVELGDHDVDVAVVTEVSPAGVPTNFAFEGESERGLAFSDLVALQGEMASAGDGSSVSLDGYPDLSVRDAEIRFAPQPFERLGIEAGFALVGDVWVDADGSEARFAALDMRLADDGLTAVGSLSEYDLGPISWSDVVLDLALTASDQHFLFDGRAELFGFSGGASVDLSSDSLFFRGQQALEDLRRAVDLFEQLVRDPVGTLARIDEIFEAAGVPAPAWVSDLADTIEPLVDSGDALTAQAIDVVLDGGTIPLPTSPPGGENPGCLLSAPIEGPDGRCYTTPPIPATAGVPSGGEAKECSRFLPNEQGGRCYRTLPKGERCLASFDFLGETYGMILRDDGRCYARIPKLTGGYRYEPSGGVAPTIDRGSPSGGDPKICRAETPIEVGDRCYTVPPTPAVDGIPATGVPKDCKAMWRFENGKCWRISPSQAASGLGTPGLCKQFDVSCDLDDLVAGDVARALFDGVMERLDDW